MTRAIYILASLVVVMSLLLQSYRYQNSLVEFTTFIICVWSILAIFNKRNLSFSLYKTFYTFVLLFFGIAPYLQFTQGIVFWRNESPYSAEDYILTNSLILVILIFFEIIYSRIYQLPLRPVESAKAERQLNVKNKILLLILALISLYLTLSSTNFKVPALFFRGADFLENKEEITPLDQVINNFFRPLSLLIFLFYYQYSKFDLLALFFLLIGVFCNFPTGLARYNAAALYIPFILIVFPKIRLKYYFNLIIVLGFLVIFPFLNNFRNYSKSQEIKLGFDFNMFTEGHFDSYMSLLRVIKFDMITNGYQILGVLFFWIPRSIWPSKPIGSGAYMAEELGLYFNNISLNYFGEGYINFGIWGVALFTVFIAVGCAYMDKDFISQKHKSKSSELYYFIITGFLIFMLRGDLLSSTAYLIGFLLSVKFISLLVRKI